VISGAHVIIYSTGADADRAFLKDVLGLPSVDTGGGWLIFALPPSEVAVHPFETNGHHELFFLVNDINVFLAAMQARNVPTTSVKTERWGFVTQVTLPGGSNISVYEPRHAQPAARETAIESEAHSAS
jgi:hypothetical protein